MSLKFKLISSKLALAIIPAVLIAVVILWQTTKATEQMSKQADDGLNQASELAHSALVVASDSELSHIVENLYAMCTIQNDLCQEKLGSDLRVTMAMIKSQGGIAFGDEEVEWQAVNQYTNAVEPVSLPKMMLGDHWLGQNTDPTQESLLVDQSKATMGGVCTIYQRMNKRGDMLRVCTNVTLPEGKRAIGTYIPAIQSDGQPDPVVSKILRGEPYIGRSVVVDTWYIAAYEPLYDQNGEVIGILGIGVKQELSDTLRNSIMKIKVGETGYAFVLNAKGETRGHYVISKNGTRDGEDISTAKDADGVAFIQNICDKALALGPGKLDECEYNWKNPGETTARAKVTKLTYFEPWDWVIAAGAYQEELHAAANKIDSEATVLQGQMQDELNQAMTGIWFWGSVTLGAILTLSLVIALWLTRQITVPISRIVSGLTESAEQNRSAGEQIAQSATELAEGASEQAGALEECSASLHELASMSQKTSESATQASNLAGEARTSATNGGETMQQLNGAMTAINQSSAEISKIIKVIEEIAFQTNLLALNAAVEAARAGEQGKGFAVVAEEVRNLAMRAGAAARETTDLIERAVGSAQEGSSIANNASGALEQIVGNVSDVADLLTSIAQAANDQSEGVAQINAAVSQMDSVTQQNASGAEESASAAEELAAQAGSVQDMVAELASVIDGKPRQSHRPAPPSSSAPKQPQRSKPITPLSHHDDSDDFNIEQF